MEFLVLLGAFILIVMGFTYLTLRRRDEMLEDMFTPEEPELAREFFQRMDDQLATMEANHTSEQPPAVEVAAQDDDDSIQWGDVPTVP